MYIDLEAYPWFIQTCALAGTLMLVFFKRDDTAEGSPVEIEHSPPSQSHRLDLSLKALKNWKQPIRNDTWPHLCSITLPNLAFQRRDADMDAITDEAISQFWTSSPGTTWSNLASLRRLSTLSLESCPSIPSAAAQEIMESCPRLISLGLGELHLRDIRKGRPWVCTGLKTFSVQLDLRPIHGMIRQDLPGEADGTDGTLVIEGQEKEAGAHDEKSFIQDQRFVFEKLSTLTSLESLKIGPINDDVSLATLRELRTLSLPHAVMSLKREDVEWMTAHWPKFSVLHRRLLNDDDEKVEAPNEFLEARGVDTSMSYWTFF
ncbi:hypothetical protein BGX29_007710 [Mortierella sp. GBA35]|nr:hypothetical protein BGX29_007710 [Mortierella sp. GBA35]